GERRRPQRTSGAGTYPGDAGGAGAGPADADRERDPHHAPCAPCPRQDLRRRQGGDSGMRVGVHQLRHRRGQRTVPHAAPQDRQRRRHRVGPKPPRLRRLRRAPQRLPAPHARPRGGDRWCRCRRQPRRDECASPRGPARDPRRAAAGSAPDVRAPVSGAGSESDAAARVRSPGSGAGSESGSAARVRSPGSGAVPGVRRRACHGPAILRYGYEEGAYGAGSSNGGAAIGDEESSSNGVPAPGEGTGEPELEPAAEESHDKPVQSG
ncbi:hypothetical protein CFC21_102215, partial [Triticum aestivum]